MSDDLNSISDEARASIAWLLWCASEGCLNAEDRTVLANWFLNAPEQLHSDDRAARPHWLAMADEVAVLLLPVLERTIRQPLLAAADTIRREVASWQDDPDAPWQAKASSVLIEQLFAMHWDPVVRGSVAAPNEEKR